MYFNQLQSWTLSTFLQVLYFIALKEKSLVLLTKDKFFYGNWCMRNDSVWCVVWWSFTFHLWLWQGVPFFCRPTFWTRQTQWETGLRSCIKVVSSVPGHPCSWSRRWAVATISSLPNQVCDIGTPFKGVFIGILYLMYQMRSPKT